MFLFAMYYNSLTMITKDSELIKSVKERIRAYMRAKNISFYALSVRTGLSEACLRNWYTAKQYTPTLEALEKVCTALGIYPYELFCRYEEVMPVSEEKRAMLEKIDRLSDKQKHALEAILDSYLS